MRFSDEQKNFRDAMIIMIGLYYLIKDAKDNDEYFLSESVIRLLAKLFHKTIPNFSPCIYYPVVESFCHRADHDRINLTDRPLTIEGLKGFYKFMDIMEALREDLRNGTFDLVMINHAHYESNVRRDLRDLPSKFSQSAPNIINKLRDHSWMTSHIPIGSKYKIKRMKDDFKISIKPSSYFVDVHLNEPPPYYDSFYVQYNWESHFFASLGKRKHETIEYIPAIQGSIFFIDIIKYILVKYTALFGSFERIKICKNCGKIFYEKKHGHKIFCSTLCRAHFHVESEPQNIYRCRARQNQWSGRKLPKITTLYVEPLTITKGDCENKCKNRPIGEKEPKGGQCFIAQENYAIDLKRIRKREKMEREERERKRK
jgi:hypothetical protein